MPNQIVEIDFHRTIVEVADVVNIFSSGGSGGDPGSVFVRGVSSSGIVADLVWAVSGKHLEAATTDTSQITITAIVEGSGPTYQPTVIVGGVDAVVTETSTTRIFQAVATVNLDVGENVIEVTSSTGARDSVLILSLIHI